MTSFWSLALVCLIKKKNVLYKKHYSTAFKNIDRFPHAAFIKLQKHWLWKQPYTNYETKWKLLVDIAEKQNIGKRQPQVLKHIEIRAHKRQKYI